MAMMRQVSRNLARKAILPDFESQHDFVHCPEFFCSAIARRSCNPTIKKSYTNTPSTCTVNLEVRPASRKLTNGSKGNDGV